MERFIKIALFSVKSVHNDFLHGNRQIVKYVDDTSPNQLSDRNTNTNCCLRGDNEIKLTGPVKR